MRQSDHFGESGADAAQLMPFVLLQGLPSTQGFQQEDRFVCISAGRSVCPLDVRDLPSCRPGFGCGILSVLPVDDRLLSLQIRVSRLAQIP